MRFAGEPCGNRLFTYIAATLSPRFLGGDRSRVVFLPTGGAKGIECRSRLAGVITSLWQFHELEGGDFPLGSFTGADLDEAKGVSLIAIEGEAAPDEQNVFVDEVG